MGLSPFASSSPPLPPLPVLSNFKLNSENEIFRPLESSARRLFWSEKTPSWKDRLGKNGLATLCDRTDNCVEAKLAAMPGRNHYMGCY